MSQAAVTGLSISDAMKSTHEVDGNFVRDALNGAYSSRATGSASQAFGPDEAVHKFTCSSVHLASRGADFFSKGAP